MAIVHMQGMEPCNVEDISASRPTHRDGIPIYYWKHGESGRFKEGWNYFPNGNKVLWWDVVQQGFSPEPGTKFEPVEGVKMLPIGASFEEKVNFVTSVLQERAKH